VLLHVDRADAGLVQDRVIKAQINEGIAPAEQAQAGDYPQETIHHKYCGAGVAACRCRAYTLLDNALFDVPSKAAGHLLRGTDMISKFISYSGLAGAVLSALLVGDLARASDADTDRPGGMDNAIISRYQGSTLYMYGSNNFGTAEIVFMDKAKGKPVLQTVEGRISNKLYWAPKGRSSLEVFRNYQSALAAAGFETIASCEAAACAKLGTDWLVKHMPANVAWQAQTSEADRLFDNISNGFHHISAKKVAANGTVYVQIALIGGDDNNKKFPGRVPQFVQIVEPVQLDGGKVVVNASVIGDSLKRDGRIALYGVLFDTNKAVVKAESNLALEEMAKALKADPALKVFVVGHTDNQGNVQANTVLSQKRAEAVVDMLHKQYSVAMDRMQAHGLANFSPVANNTSEEGRAKNRRVEMVVQ